MTAQLVITPLSFEPDGSVDTVVQGLWLRRLAVYRTAEGLVTYAVSQDRAFTPAEQARWEELDREMRDLDCTIAIMLA